MAPVLVTDSALVEDPPAIVRDCRAFGLLCNQASVDCQFKHAADLMHSRFPGKLAALFSPLAGAGSCRPIGWGAGLRSADHDGFVASRSRSSVAANGSGPGRRRNRPAISRPTCSSTPQSTAA